MTRILQRRLTEAPDPLALYAAISAGGTKPDTALFQGPDGTLLLMGAAAVRAELRGNLVRLQALSANGEALLAAVDAPELVSRCRDRVELSFRPSETGDAEERLLGPRPLHGLRRLLVAAGGSDADPFGVALLGVLGFDQAGFGEAISANQADRLDLPDGLFWIPETLMVFDGQASARLLCTAFGTDRRQYHDAEQRLAAFLNQSGWVAPFLPASGSADHVIKVDLDDKDYCSLVARMKDEIAAGEVYQIVPSRTFSARCPCPLSAFAHLRRIESNGYHFYLRGEGFTLLGASPETAVRLYRDKGGLIVEVKPIAGTRPRGGNPDEDDRLEAEMRLDAKELAEHMMLLDLARNDVARISMPGTRRVARLLNVERFARVMHLVSSVTGTLRIGLDAFDALAAALNVGTLTGAPKVRAMQLLAEHERTRRGFYGGAVGWVNGAGLMDTAVVIRSALVVDGTAHVRAGAGVVHDSDPAAEAEETRRKASALLSVLGASSERQAAV